MKYIIVILILFGQSFSHQAVCQNTITLDEAIQMAIQNNYGIQIANNLIEQSQNSTTRGNAGQLPEANLSSQVQQTFGNESLNNTSHNTINYGGEVNVSYNLYNGGKARSRYRLLKIQQEQATIQQERVLENITIQVVKQYLKAASALKRKITQTESLKLSRKRLNQIKTGREFGNNTKLDELNARVDFNKDSTTLINLQSEYKRQKIMLIELISQTWINTEFEVSVAVDEYATFKLNDLIQESLSRNANIRIAENQLSQSQQNIRLRKADAAPKISIRSGYQLNAVRSPFNKTHQMQSGVHLSMPIFNGHKQQIQVKNARLNKHAQYLSLEQRKLEIEKQVRILHEQYQNQIQNIKAGQTNLSASELNLVLSTDMLQNGQITSTQFREAQQNLLLAKTNIATAEYTAKQLEFELLKISGHLF